MKRPSRAPFPFNGMPLLLVVTLLAVALLPAGVAALTPTPVLAASSAPHAPTAASWYDGSIQYSTITNCVSIIQGFPYLENGMGTYVGFYADPDSAVPAPNAPYYIHVVVAGMGNACSGMRAAIDIGLPPNTSLAISGTNKVNCYYDNVPLSLAECTQALPTSPYNAGMLNIPSSDAAHGYLWPMPQGHILEIQIPVQSSTTLTNSALTALVLPLDGNGSIWLQPQAGVYVFSSQPTILYPSPSTTIITATSAHSAAYLYTHGVGGTGYFDLGLTTSYGVHEAVIIPAGGNAFSAWDDWGPPPLQPDTLYHWRFTFTPTSGSPVIGADQTFRTLPDGRITIGTGSAVSCTAGTLTSALATAKEILFDCGALPTTITLSGTQIITAANLTINGGNKVTLDMGGTANHFNVQGGAHLTLTQIELAHGSGTCGGAVHVLGSALLTLNDVRFNSNSAVNGGAVCIDALGQATADYSLFLNNHASLGGGVYNSGTLTVTHSSFITNTATTHAGAIENYGTATVSDSVFTQNSATALNGGAIDTTVNLTIARSVFTGNQAGTRGGAINNYLGTLLVSDSRFLNNHSSGYGGGIVNDAGDATVFSTEISGNSANSVGGGVRNSGTFSITNSTVTNNSAVAGGGGFENTGTLALLNVTVAGNTSPATGGNLYLGAAASASLTLKNTLVAAGLPNNCDKAITSLGNNLESANTCGLTAAGDLPNSNPRLGELQYDRANTRTLPLLPGSPAIDAASNTVCPATDQRGFASPLDGDKNASMVCDIGAFEFNYTLDLPRLFLPMLRR